jgi:heme/copper-type cytochrome/quinol oxidase subunit 2
MPIAVHAVTDAEFKSWVTQAKKAANAGPVTQSVLAEVEQTEAKDIKR